MYTEMYANSLFARPLTVVNYYKVLYRRAKSTRNWLARGWLETAVSNTRSLTVLEQQAELLGARAYVGGRTRVPKSAVWRA